MSVSDEFKETLSNELAQAITLICDKRNAASEVTIRLPIVDSGFDLVVRTSIEVSQ